MSNDPYHQVPRNLKEAVTVAKMHSWMQSLTLNHSSSWLLRYVLCNIVPVFSSLHILIARQIVQHKNMPLSGHIYMFLVQALLYLQETHNRMATFNLTNYLADPVGLIQCFFPWKSWSQEPVVCKSLGSMYPNQKKHHIPPQKSTNLRDIPFFFQDMESFEPTR